MPETTVRRSKNSQFAYAAAAMGAFWERARRAEAHRRRELRERRSERARALAFAGAAARG